MCLNRFCNQFVNLVFKLTTDFESLLKSFTCLKVQKPAVNGFSKNRKICSGSSLKMLILAVLLKQNVEIGFKK